MIEPNMNNNYSAKKIGYFVFFITLFLVVSIYLWVNKASTYEKQNRDFSSQLTSLLKLSSLNKEINDKVKTWPEDFSKEKSVSLEQKLDVFNELVTNAEIDNATFDKTLEKNREYWLLLSDHSTKLKQLSTDSTSAYYTVLNNAPEQSKALLTIITRMPEQHHAFITQHAKIAYAAIKRDIALFKTASPNQQGELDRYMGFIDQILSQVEQVTPILSTLQATRFEREYDLGYYIKNLIEQRQISLKQVKIQEQTHLYYLFAILFVFIIVFGYKCFVLVRHVEIYRKKSLEIERYSKRKITQYKLAEKSKSNFLMIISYEARTALDVIMGLTKFVTENNVNDLQKSKLDQVSTTSKKLNLLLNDVLELIDLDMQSVELESEVFSPKNVLQVLSDKYQNEAKNSGVLFEELIDKDLSGSYIGDQSRFYQLLDYLLSNSFTSTEQGHVSFTVNLDAGRGLSDQYQRINIQIEDTGIKPTDNEIKTLFESFSMTKFQASRKAGSEGVRLSIIKSLVTLMKGEIEATHSGSNVMKYNLHIYLEPSKSGDEAVSVEGLTNEPSKSHLVEIPSLNILIVEDSSVNAFLLKWILEGFKHNVTIAKNGIECLNLVETADFDLIFMDQYMPEMNGIEATEKIRALTNHKSKTPIIGCTADGFQETRLSLLEAGQNDIIIKPITNTVVADVIQKYLHGEYKVQSLEEKQSKEDTIETSNDSDDN